MKVLSPAGSIVILSLLVVSMGSFASYGNNFSSVHAPVTLTSPDAQTGGSFGQTIVSGKDGATTYFVVGAPHETTDGQVAAGRAYVYNAKSGSLIDDLTAPNPQAYTQFGASLGFRLLETSLQ